MKPNKAENMSYAEYKIMLESHLKKCEEIGNKIMTTNLEVLKLSELSSWQDTEIKKFVLVRKADAALDELRHYDPKLWKVRKVIQEFHDDIQWHERPIHLERTIEIVNYKQAEVFLITCSLCEETFKIPLAWTKIKHGFYIGNYVNHVKFMHPTQNFSTNFSHLVEI